VAVRVRDERVAAAAGLGVAVVLDARVQQLLVGVEDVLDAHRDVAERVAVVVLVGVVVLGEFEERAVLPRVLGAEVDVRERLGLPARVLDVVEVVAVPLDGLPEVADAHHHVVEYEVRHAPTVSWRVEKRTGAGTCVGYSPPRTNA